MEHVGHPALQQLRTKKDTRQHTTHAEHILLPPLLHLSCIHRLEQQQPTTTMA